MRNVFYFLFLLLLSFSLKAQEKSFFNIPDFIGERGIDIGTVKDSLHYIPVINSEINKKIFPLYVSYQLKPGLYFNVDSLDKIAAIIIESDKVDAIREQIISISGIHPISSRFGTDGSSNEVFSWKFKNCNITAIKYPFFEGVILYNGLNKSYFHEPKQ